MDENRWTNERNSAQHMLAALSKLGVQRKKSGQRKLRLFAVECCYRVKHLLPDDRLHSALNVAGQFAEGEVGKAELASAESLASPLKADGMFPGLSAPAARAICMTIFACHSAPYTAAFMVSAYLPSPIAKTRQKGDQMLCDLLRCVFGDPLQKPAFNKKWRTETVTELAAGIYEERAFDRLPILADALEEAGCDDPAMLSHLRGHGPHCRGCWVLDLALGK